MKGTIKVDRRKIRALMYDKRTNCARLAARMGYSREYVEASVSKGYMSKFLLESIAKQLNVKPEELLDGFDG